MAPPAAKSWRRACNQRWNFVALPANFTTSCHCYRHFLQLHWRQNHRETALETEPLYRDKWTTIIRLWWLSQLLVSYGHHLVVTIYVHSAQIEMFLIKHQIAVFPLFYGATNGLGALKLSLSPGTGNPRYATAWSVICFLQSAFMSVAATWYCR